MFHRPRVHYRFWMKIFTVHINTNDDHTLENMHFIAEGFSFTAAIFQQFWFLYHRAWSTALAIMIVVTALALMLQYDFFSVYEVTLIQLAIFLYLGFEAQDLRRAILRKKGFRLIGIVAAKNENEAKIRFLDGYLKTT